MVVVCMAAGCSPKIINLKKSGSYVAIQLASFTWPDSTSKFHARTLISYHLQHKHPTSYSYVAINGKASWSE